MAQARLYEERARGRWRVTFTEGGKRKTRCFTNQAEAEAFLARLRTEGAAPEPAAGPADARTWCASLDQVRVAIERALASGNADPLQAGRVLASLALARSRYQDSIELEAELKDLRRMVAEIEGHARGEGRTGHARVGNLPLLPGPAPEAGGDN